MASEDIVIKEGTPLTLEELNAIAVDLKDLGVVGTRAAVAYLNEVVLPQHPGVSKIDCVGDALSNVILGYSTIEYEKLTLTPWDLTPNKEDDNARCHKHHHELPVSFDIDGDFFVMDLCMDEAMGILALSRLAGRDMDMSIYWEKVDYFVDGQETVYCRNPGYNMKKGKDEYYIHIGSRTCYFRGKCFMGGVKMGAEWMGLKWSELEQHWIRCRDAKGRDIFF